MYRSRVFLVFRALWPYVHGSSTDSVHAWMHDLGLTALPIYAISFCIDSAYVKFTREIPRFTTDPIYAIVSLHTAQPVAAVNRPTRSRHSFGQS